MPDDMHNLIPCHYNHLCLRVPNAHLNPQAMLLLTLLACKEADQAQSTLQGCLFALCATLASWEPARAWCGVLEC